MLLLTPKTVTKGYVLKGAKNFYKVHCVQMCVCVCVRALCWEKSADITMLT